MSIPNPPVKLFGEASDLTSIISSTEYNAKQSCRVGTVRKDDQGNVYRFVKFDEDSTITATAYGMCCYDGSTRTEVKKPITAQLNNPAGFWQAAVTGGSYGWIQCKGTGTGLLVRSGAASTDSAASVAAFASNWIGINGQEYVSAAASTTALVKPSVLNAAAVASQASTGVGSQTGTITFDFRL